MLHNVDYFKTRTFTFKGPMLQWPTSRYISTRFQEELPFSWYSAIYNFHKQAIYLHARLNEYTLYIALSLNRWEFKAKVKL